MSYSQRDEERVILEHFGDSDGTYLDCGAYDGRTFSNIRALSERGWKGVCVEPSAHAFAAMLENPPPGARLVNAMIGPRTGLGSFLHSKDTLSTSDRRHAKKWAGATTFTPIFVGSITIQELLKECPGPYRFISVDVEGMSMWVLGQLIPLLDHLKTEMVCVEFDDQTVHIPGWKQIYKSEENVIVKRK